jgi:hypothetical protein
MSSMSGRTSEGLSLKPPGYAYQSSNSASMKKYGYDDGVDDCCCEQCERHQCTCLGKPLLTCGYFKKRRDCGFCCVLALMLTCLFVAVIAPLVLNALIDSEVNSELVIDSPDAPSFKLWQTNAVGTEGEKVRQAVCFVKRYLIC